MSRISYCFSLVALAAVQWGCVITLVDGPSDGSDIYGSSWSDTSSTSGGYGAGGAGGSTGTVPQGAGGATSSSATTGSGMGTPSSSASAGSGAGPTCTAGNGTGENANLCEWLSAANTKCGGAQPLAYGTCKRGFAIFKGASAEELYNCLDATPQAAACEADPVQKCIDRMYDDACPDASIAATCNEWASVCGKAGQALDAKRCALDLNPFNAAAMDAMVVCMNKASGTCQQAYDACFDQALAI